MSAPSEQASETAPEPRIVYPHQSAHAEPMHGWFGLSYSSYVVLERTVIQSMPDQWQRRLCELLEEAAAAVEDVPEAQRPEGTHYHVTLRRDKGEHGSGRMVENPLANYQRGRRRLPLHPVRRATPEEVAQREAECRRVADAEWVEMKAQRPDLWDKEGADAR